ncbi:MAG: LamG domain-containing protein [Kiritimatiellae bacterium]|nr:LamG domain-containing protein [Kiritimatiellia bacterium]
MLLAVALAAIFTASYDADFRGEVGHATVNADYSGGVLWEDIEAHLKPGLSGRSASIGTPETKASALYAVYRNMDFLRPEEGGISFWMQPVDWTGDDGRYHIFLRAEGPDADLLVYKTSSNVLRVYSSFRRKKVFSCLDCTAKGWIRGQWHHIAVEWKEGSARLFVDGALRTSGAFQLPGSGYDRIGVGGLRPLDWKNPMNFTQIDELRIASETRDEAAVAKEYGRLCAKTGINGAATGLDPAEVKRAMEEPEPWRTEKLGYSTACPSPWTPVEWDAKTLTLRCWNREYVFGNRALPVRIVSDGTDVLSCPVAFELDGQEVPFGIPKVVEANASEVVLVAYGQMDGFDATAKTRIAFDGFAWTEIELAPKSATGAFRSLQTTFAFPKANATLFNAMKKQYMEFSPGHAGKFRDYRHDLFGMESRCIFVGNERIGLEWTCEELTDWYLKDNASSLKLVSGEGENRLILTMADRASEPGRTCHYRFGWQALPVKPLTRKWRLARTFSDNPEGFVPYFEWENRHNVPLVEKACTNYAEIVARQHRRSPEILAYLAGFTTSPDQRAWIRHGHEWNKTPPAAGTVGSASNPREAFCWVCAAAPGWADYYVWNLAKCIDELGFEGLYFDNQDPQFCDNAVHGCGFKGRDGKRYATYNLLATRSLAEREYRIFKSKRPKGRIMRHMSMKTVMALDSLCDFIVDGECYCGTLSRKESYVDIFSPDLFRAMYAPTPYGIPRYFIPQIERSIKIYGKDRNRYSTPEKARAEHIRHMPAARHFFAYLVVHDCLLWRGGGISEKPWYDILGRFGLDGTERFVGYTDPASPFGYANERVMISSYVKGDQLLAIIFNDTDVPLEDVRFDRQKLDALVPGVKLLLKNEETRADVTVAGECIRLKVPPRDYVIIGNF